MPCRNPSCERLKAKRKRETTVIPASKPALWDGVLSLCARQSHRGVRGPRHHYADYTTAAGELLPSEAGADPAEKPRVIKWRHDETPRLRRGPRRASARERSTFFLTLTLRNTAERGRSGGCRTRRTRAGDSFHLQRSVRFARAISPRFCSRSVPNDATRYSVTLTAARPANTTCSKSAPASCA